MMLFIFSFNIIFSIKQITLHLYFINVKPIINKIGIWEFVPVKTIKKVKK